MFPDFHTWEKEKEKTFKNESHTSLERYEGD